MWPHRQRTDCAGRRGAGECRLDSYHKPEGSYESVNKQERQWDRYHIITKINHHTHKKVPVVCKLHIHIHGYVYVQFAHYIHVCTVFYTDGER